MAPRGSHWTLKRRSPRSLTSTQAREPCMVRAVPAPFAVPVYPLNLSDDLPNCHETDPRWLACQRSIHRADRQTGDATENQQSRPSHVCSGDRMGTLQ